MSAGSSLTADQGRQVFYTWSAQRDAVPLEIVGGRGAHFETADGARWLDLGSMTWNANLGHGHPAMRRALVRAAERSLLVQPGSVFPDKVHAAERLLAVAPPGLQDGKVFFCLSGAEANENAVKMARLVTGRRKIVYRSRSYHGATLAMLREDWATHRHPLWLFPATGRDHRQAALADGPGFGLVVQLGESYERLIESDSRPPIVPVELADPALILYTSGTTGRPKGAVLSHGNLTWNTLNQFAHMEFSRADVTLCSAPLFHVLGLGQITLPTLFAGGSVVVIPKFDPGAFLKTVAVERATAFPLAPTMLQMLSDHPDWDATDTSSVRGVSCGGSPIPERVAEKWLARNIRLLQGYGMTEASPGVYMALQYGARQRPASVGVPHFFTDTALLTADGSIIRGPGQGELLVTGPNVFSHYWNRPKETADAFLDGWFRTGDVVRIDEDGWAYVVDRVKDMFISGGENVYPAEVEAAIGTLDGVSASGVVGVPDDRWGEVGLAFIVVRPGATLDETAIRKHLDGQLARYKIPRRFVFVDELPRTASGKVLRHRLHERAQQIKEQSQ